MGAPVTARSIDFSPPAAAGAKLDESMVDSFPHPTSMSTAHSLLRAPPVVVSFDCAYDLSTFGSSVAMDSMRTHPLVSIGGVLQEHPFFVPADQFLLVEIRERRSAHQSARMAS